MAEACRRTIRSPRMAARPTCPQCQSTNVRPRQTVTPPWLCNRCGHAFYAPSAPVAPGTTRKPEPAIRLRNIAAGLGVVFMVVVAVGLFAAAYDSCCGSGHGHKASPTEPGAPPSDGATANSGPSSGAMGTASGQKRPPPRSAGSPLATASASWTAEGVHDPPGTPAASATGSRVHPPRMPTVDEIVALVVDVEARIKDDPSSAREALRQMLLEGALVMAPLPDGSY
jgi:ribosomal protein L37AE/L43A